MDEIIKAGAGGVTVAETRGKGSSPRPSIGGARGTARYLAEYNRTDTVTTIVEDSKVDDIIKAIMKACQTGKKGDGKIFVSSVVEFYDITTGRKEIV